MRQFILIMLTLFLSFAYAAQIYMNQDKNGNVTYSDTPLSPNSQPIATPTGNIVSGTPTAAPMPGNNPLAPNPLLDTVNSGNKAYTSFDIATPANGETIQNQPGMSVIITITPPLQPGDYVQVFLDGRPWGKAGPMTAFSFVTPDRGTHSVSAKLFNKDNQVLKTSSSNTFYVHQAALGANGISPNRN